MKHILIITYSQTGQTNEIANSILAGFDNEVKVDKIYISPLEDYAFPWTGFDFFNAMPETVLEEKMELKSINQDLRDSYDLILLGWQPWYLSVNRPILSFMYSDLGKSLFKDTPVVTFLGCRNMWVSANEKMKRHLQQLGAKHVGQMALVNKSTNLISLITILAWMLKGIKDNFLGIFPDAGIDKSYFSRLPECGKIIQKHLFSGNWSTLQQELLSQNIMEVKPALILMEKTGSGNFVKFAKWIKSAPNNHIRRKRVVIFSRILPTAIVLLTPIITILRPLQVLLKRKKLKKDAEYLLDVKFEQNRFHS